MLLWSERTGPRLREIGADLATAAWLTIWTVLGIRLYSRLAEFAGTGRLIRDGGNNLRETGGEVANVVQGIPLVGADAAIRIRDAFGFTADPVVQFGTDLERLLVMIAALLALIVVAIALVPWLNRYVPWRVARIRRLNAGARVIRRGLLHAHAQRYELHELLASRALHRLDYDKLLEYTPDPFGDWEARRFDRLVQAELETIGLARA